MKEEAILLDLSRTIYVEKMIAADSAQKASGMVDKNGLTKAQTSTWLKIYPYTQPLITVRVKKNIEDQAFKEKWETPKTEAEIKRVTQMEVKRLIQDKQCFAVEINAVNPAAIDLKTWYGDLKQGASSQKLGFSKGDGHVVTTRHTTVSGYGGLYTATSSDSHEYFYYADACGTGPLDLVQAFDVQLEPRYERELLPMKLEWLAPTNEASK